MEYEKCDALSFGISPSVIVLVFPGLISSSHIRISFEVLEIYEANVTKRFAFSAFTCDHNTVAYFYSFMGVYGKKR